MKQNVIKNSIMSFVLVALCSNASFAQKLDAAKVPAVVKASFTKAFPKATAVKWEMEDKDYEVGFKQDGKEMSAVMDAKGTLKETETDIKVAALPKAAMDYMAAHYRGAKIKEAAMIKAANGTVTYEAEITGKDIIFDSKGGFVKEVKKAKEEKD